MSTATVDPITTAELIRRLSAAEADLRSIHASRHEANARLSEVIDAEREARMTLEEKLEKLVGSVQSLVDAIGGGAFGQPGLIKQLSDLNAKVDLMKQENHDYREKLDARLNEGRGMLRLAAWTGAALGTFATLKALFP